MKKIIPFTLLIWLISIGCSKDDPSGVPATANEFPSFTALAIKDEAVFQLNIFNNATAIEEFDLSNDLGVPFEFERLDVSGDLLTFYDVTFNNFSVYQKDLVTGSTFVSEVICPLDLGETRFFPLNSENKLLIFSVVPNGCSPLMNNLYIRDKGTDVCNKIRLQDSFDCNSNFSGIVIGETAYLSQLLSNGQARVFKFNLNTMEEEEEVFINGAFKATVDEDTFYVFTENTLVMYNSADLSFKNSANLSTSLGGQLDGWFKTSFNGDQMLIDIQYPQPSAIEQGPAIFDLGSGEISEGNDTFFFDLREQLSTELGTDLFYSAYTVDMSNETILVAYQTGLGQDFGGVVLTNFEGEILSRIELEFEVQKLILR